MKDRLDHARGWLLKAESDLLAAEKLATGGGPYDMACFHSQQAAEKYLKALLAFADQPIPRTHNLEDLDRLCEQAVSNWHSAGGVSHAADTLRRVAALRLRVLA